MTTTGTNKKKTVYVVMFDHIVLDTYNTRERAETAARALENQFAAYKGIRMALIVKAKRVRI